MSKETTDTHKNTDAEFTPATFFLLLTTGSLVLSTIGVIAPISGLLSSAVGALGFSSQLKSKRFNLWSKLKNIMAPEKTLSAGMISLGIGTLSYSPLLLITGAGLISLRIKYPNFIRKLEENFNNIKNFCTLMSQTVKASPHTPSTEQLIRAYDNTSHTIQYLMALEERLVDAPIATLAEEGHKAIAGTGQVAVQLMDFTKNNPAIAAKNVTATTVGSLGLYAASPAINIISDTASSAASYVPIIGPILSPVIWLASEFVGHWLAYSIPSKFVHEKIDALIGTKTKEKEKENPKTTEETKTTVAEYKKPTVNPINSFLPKYGSLKAISSGCCGNNSTNFLSIIGLGGIFGSRNRNAYH